FFFESLLVPKSAEICRLLCIWLDLFRVGVDGFGGGLRAETYLPRLSFYRCPINFGSRRRFLDSDGPITFDSISGVRI
ncbi:hypothetical protein A2U01_0042461, partial [Trifolium medium]|nr:hypothetical protein [Trifolium medium]